MAKELLTGERIKIGFGLNSDDQQTYSTESLWASALVLTSSAS